MFLIYTLEMLMTTFWKQSTYTLRLLTVESSKYTLQLLSEPPLKAEYLLMIGSVAHP